MTVMNHAAATNQDMPTRRHTKRLFSTKECENSQKTRVAVQSFLRLADYNIDMYY